MNYRYSEAETTLTGEDHLRTQHFDEITTEFGEIACFALQLLSKICQQTERTQLANEASHKVVKLNPFLFHSFTDLCNRGEKPDPAQIFQLSSADVFQNSQCRQNWFGGGAGLWTENSNNSFLINHSSSDIMAMMNNSIGNSNSNSYNNLNILLTPLDQIAAPHVLPPQQTPNNNVNIANALRGMGGAVIEDSTPLCNYRSSTDIPQSFDATATPFRKNFKYLSAYSPTTPSFGVLPLINSPNNDGFLNVTPSPQLQQPMSQQMDTTEAQQQTNNKSIANSKKLKNNIGIITRNISKMETPPSVVVTPQTLLPPPAVTTVVVGPLQHTKPVFQQTGNITTPRTPNTLNAGVRRSSRLFSSNNNYSVAKENTKSPHITNNNNINNKFATPRSPARKTKQRASKINLNNTSLQELSEKKEKVETITSGIDSVDTKVLLNNSVNSAQNFAQRLLMMKKQSADGLMVLLRELGEGYLHLAQYECKEAIKCFEVSFFVWILS
jgi:anaphase-promoting complex subunit 3